jgi:ATP-binding cassette subfamily B protein
MKLIYQHDSMECGAACLAMISSHFKKSIPLKEIAKACNATKDGVSMLGLKQVATEYGFEVIIGHGKIEDIDNEDLPCILYWNQNHFVVLYKIDFRRNKYYVADPAKGKCKYGKEYINNHWVSTDNSNGIAMFFENKHSLKKQYDLSEERSFSFLFSYIRQYKKYFIQIFLGLLLGCLLQLLMPFLTQTIVDIGITHRDISLIWMILLGELTIVIGSTATDFIRRWLLLHISLRINISLVSDFLSNC